MDLFFIASKLLSFLEQPLNWVLSLLLLSGLCALVKRHTAAKRLRALSIILLLLIGVVAIPDVALQRLEDAVPTTSHPIDAFEGVIVLGGVMQSGRMPIERRQVLLGDAAERITEAVALARRYPALKIVFSGFSPEIFPDGISEADAAAQFFEQQGIPGSRLIREGRSRNTHENALYSLQLPGIDAAKRWLLLTSASHMPRAFAIFKKAGWNVEPYPVDFHTGRTINYLHYSLVSGADRWNIVLHELLGIAVYKITGRI